MRQQYRRQQLWMWRHHAFAEMVTVALMSAASQHVKDSSLRRTAHRFDLRICEAHNKEDSSPRHRSHYLENELELVFYVGTAKSISSPETVILGTLF